MRTVTVDLYVNDGTNNQLSGIGLANKIVSLGSISWDIDEEITIATPGNLSVKVHDDDGAVWDWITNYISSGGGTQLFPPWVVLSVNSSTAFVGVMDLAAVKKDTKNAAVDISAQDWTVMLKDNLLDGTFWERPRPKTISVRAGSSPYTGYKWLLFGASVIVFTADMSSAFQEGDLFQVNGSGPYYKAWSMTVNETITQIKLDGWNWDMLGGAGSASFVRASMTYGDLAYYTVTTTVTGTTELPIFEIPVDTVDFLVPGDVLERSGKGKLNVDDIDAERKLIISATPITETYSSGDRLILTKESKSELVQQDAFQVIQKGIMPFSLDYSQFVPPGIGAPCFSFLPWWNKSIDENMRGLHDAEPTTTGIKLFGAEGQVWTGVPEAGMAVSPDIGVRVVDWTSQQTSAPLYLMPDDSPTITPRDRDRNRGYYEWKFAGYPQLLNYDWTPLTTPVNTTIPAIPTYVLAYDYSQLRRWTLGATWTEERWNGSTWTVAATVTPSTYSGTWYPCAACPFIGQAASTGPTPLGNALLVLMGNAALTSYQLQLHFVGASAVTLSIPASAAKGARLVTTPWGVYLVGPGGYAKIGYSGGSLTFTWAQVFDATSCWLQPHTLAAIDADSLWILARLDWADPEDKMKRGSETRLLQLSPNPVDPNYVVWNGTDLGGVRLLPLPPRICRMFRDPSDQSRLVGILGSRLFQVASKLPTTLERVRVQGMTSAELLEHACQAINAIAVARTDGSILLLPRTDAGASTPVLVDKVSDAEHRISPYFFSAVRVSASDDSIYADAYGQWAGGKTMEISGHPMLHNEAQCFALAASYAAFLGKPRRLKEQKWFHWNADTAPVWETLIPWQKLTVNGSSESWLLKGLTNDIIKGEATAKLLEA